MSAESVVRNFLCDNGYTLPDEFMRYEDLKTNIRTFVSKQPINNEKRTILFGYMYWMTEDDWGDLIFFFKMKARGRIR
jgi:hypothetical protein